MVQKVAKEFKFLLVSILIVGFIVRVYGLSENPPGFFADEASIGYNAYTLINNFSDEKGNKFPVFFQNFESFYRPGLSVYLTSPFIFLLGLSEFSSRLSSVFFGTLTILIVFYLALYLFKSSKIALLSSLLLAIAPWHIHFSRINQEFIYLVFSLCLSILVFIIGVEKKKKLIPLSFVLFGLSIYSYVTAYIIIPLFVLTLLIINFKKIKQNLIYFLLGFVLLFIISTPLILGITDGKTLSRFNQLSAANQTKTSREIFKGMVDTYKGHFSSDFLFTKGDIDYKDHFITRFSVKGMGQLYKLQLPFIILGLIYSYRFKKTFLLILSWLLIYPLGSTLAPFADGGGPFATRSITGVIPFQILTGAGIFYFLNLTKNKVLKNISILLIVFLVTLSFYHYLFLYYIEYPKYSSNFWGWQFGARDIMTYFLKNQNNYDELFMSPDYNAPEIFLKFYGKNKCVKCKIGLPESSLDFNKKQLYALSPSYIEKNNLNFQSVKRIYYPTGAVAFVIGIINSEK